MHCIIYTLALWVCFVQGAMAAEALANVLMNPMKVAMQIATEHPEFDEQQLEAAVLHELRPMRNAIELTTASLALSSGNPRVLGVVAHAAGTALDHNALGPITTKVAAALAKATQTRAVQSFKAFITRSAKKSAEQAERKAFLEASKRSTTDPKAMKSYVREVEKVSGTKMGDAQKTKLVDAVRQNKYSKIAGDELKSHKKPFDSKSFKDKLISEWEKNTGQTWPKYEKNIFNESGRKIAEQGKNYQAHHIIPQQLRGPHEWWNIHPAHIRIHQGGIHGAGSQLSKILKNVPGGK